MASNVDLELLGVWRRRAGEVYHDMEVDSWVPILISHAVCTSLVGTLIF